MVTDCVFPAISASTVNTALHRFVASHVPTYKEFVLNMEEIKQNPEFLGDATGLLRPGFTFDPQAAWEKVRDDLIVVTTQVP